MSAPYSLPTQAPVQAQTYARVQPGRPIPKAGPVDTFRPEPTHRFSTETDADLVAHAQAGDHAAFEVIVNSHQQAIYNYVSRLMGSSEDAYDLTQDTFIKAYLNLTDPASRAHSDPALRVGAWLYRIAQNVCLDELRHRKLVRWTPWDAFLSVFHPSQVAPDSPEREAARGEDTEEVRAILDRMRHKYRVILELREYHDLSYDEIASVLVTTRPAVKTLLFRAREEFRRLYTAAVRRPGVERDPESAPRRGWR